MKNSTDIWWINPLKLLLRFIFPIYILIFLIPFENNGGNPYQVKNYLTFEVFILGLIFFVCFFLSFVLSNNNSRKNLPLYQEYISPSFLTKIGILSILAYFIWFNFILFNPDILIDLLSGGISPYYIRNNYTTISGLTTISQLGILYIIIYFQNKKLNKTTVYQKNIFRIIIMLTILRTIAWSERLALLEIIIPIVLFYFSILEKKQLKKRFRRIIIFLPYIGIFLLLLLFGFFEYFRSWSYYKQFYDNIFQFTTERVFMYYYGAVNSAAAILEYSNWPSLTFNTYLNWIYKFPFIGESISSALPSESYGDWESFLNRYLDPEFNNQTGLFKPYWDSGILGAIVFFLIWGALAKYSYRDFQRGYGQGLYFFPLIFISVLEALRIPYLSESRVFPVFLFAIIAYRFYKRRIVI